MKNRNLHEQILAYIDGLLHPLRLHEILPLKTNAAIDLIARIIHESGKEIGEAVMVFLAALRYLAKKPGSAQKFIKNNPAAICKIAIEKRVQANSPARALPLFDIFWKKIKRPSIAVIELGASYGLIGRCLLNPFKIKKERDSYFSPKQQMPRNLLPITDYLGIELAPPGEKWLLACTWDGIQKERLKNFLHDFSHAADKRFQFIKGNARGFSTHKAVKNLTSRHSAVIVFTSFMLYQNDRRIRNLLESEILEFSAGPGRHWINQTFDLSSQECFIEWDREKIIRLSDDSCTHWEWLI